jgi:photosystem II stability/assembly factor-like uncharacterized protein
MFSRTLHLRRRPAATLALEPLEDRTLPSTSIPLNPFQWTPLGPAPITGGNNPGSQTDTGRIDAVLADPTSSSHLFIGAADGGIWVTSDGGSTWTPLTDNQQTLVMGSLAYAPSNPTIIYAATGDADQSVGGDGVLKSVDGGATWTLLASNVFAKAAISRIVVDPTNANFVYVAVNNSSAGFNGPYGIWKSTDGGNTWTVKMPPESTRQFVENVSDLVIDPSNPQKLFATWGTYNIAAEQETNTVYESSNGGTTWAVAGNFPLQKNTGSIRIALAPSSPQTMYVASATTPPALYETMDGGQTWAQLQNVPDYLTPQGDYDSALAVDPSNPSIVYAGGTSDGGGPNLIESTNGGSTWTNITFGADFSGPHTDVHAFAFDASGKLLVGTDGGIWRLDNPNAGSIQWTDINGNLNITQFYSAALDPTSADRAYGGSQDNGTEVFNDSLVWQQSGGADTQHVEVDPQDLTTLYRQDYVGSAVIFQGVLGSSTFTSQDSMTFAVDPSNGNRVLLGTNHKLYETTNEGTSWQAIGTPAMAGWPTGDDAVAIAIAPSSPNTVYAATFFDKLLVTTNDGATWQQAAQPSGATLVNQLVVDPNNPQIVYAAVVGFNGVVNRSADGGRHWTDITGNLPLVPGSLPAFNERLDAETLALDSTNQVLYVGNAIGVYASGDGGANWSRFGTGLPNVEVKDLKLDSHLGILAAATYGRGMWEVQLVSSPAVIAGRVLDDFTGKGAAGQLVYLDLNGDGMLDGSDPSMLTAADGSYRFGNLPAGNYTVALALAPGWIQTTATPQVTLNAGQQATGVNIDVRNPGILQFSTAGYRVKEGRVATITVTRTAGSEGKVTVAYAINPDSAQPGINYLSTSGTLNFLNGQKSRSFTVRSRDDHLNNIDLTANLALSSPDGGATLGSVSSAVLTVANRDPLPRVTFRTYIIRGSESIASPSIVVILSAPSAKTITVNYAIDTPAGSAVNGVDYMLDPGTLTFAPGKVSQTIPLTVISNKLAKGQKTIRLKLFDASNATLGAYTHLTYVILEDGK